MLFVKEIKDHDEIAKWLKWMYELPCTSQPQMKFRSDVMEVFNEALPADYKAAQGMNYYLVYNDSLEQLLVKLNWGATIDAINIAGMVRVNKGDAAHICLKALIDMIHSACNEKGKRFIWARPSSTEGRRVLERLRLLVPSEYCDNKRAFRYQIY